MAGEDRTQAQHLRFLTQRAEEVRKSGLFPVLRGAEARAHGLPRIGRSKRPEQNVVDLAQEPGLGFAEKTLARIETRAGRTKLYGHWLGLTGPMGPLPTHLTEFAFYERRYAKTQPFGDWLDVLAGRMLQLFYRAWADSQPSAHADRPDEDRFATYLTALSGAGEGSRSDGAFPTRSRVHYAALFAGPRNAVAIEDGLSHLLGQKVRLLEFQPRWREFEEIDLSRLGRAYARLSDNAVLGGRIRSASDAFRVIVRARNYRDYLSLLPTGARFAIAAEALDAFRPSHIEWDLCIEIADAQAPPARLDGRAQLGWSSWIKRKSTSGIAVSELIRADAHLRRFRKSNKGTHL